MTDEGNESRVVEAIWRADYSHSYFDAYHPFYRLTGKSPLDEPAQVYGFKWEPEEGQSQRDAIARYARLADENAASEIAYWTNVKFEATRVWWAEMRVLAGISNPTAFRKALWSAVEHSFDDDVRAMGDALAKTASEAGVYLPSSTQIQPVMEALIGEAFRNAGYFDLRLTSEVQDYDVAITTDDLLSSRPVMSFVPVKYSTPSEAPDVRLRYPIWVPSQIYTPDRALKCEVEYEAISTGFFGTEAALAAARLDHLFEGEWLSRGI
ncbi:MAG: hypothetical protein QM698_15380 [Micropepsaceae bacterium]